MKMETHVEEKMVHRSLTQRVNGMKAAIHWMEPHNMPRTQRAAVLVDNRRALREFIKQETSASDQSPEPRT